MAHYLRGSIVKHGKTYFLRNILLTGTVFFTYIEWARTKFSTMSTYTAVCIQFSSVSFLLYGSRGKMWVWSVLQ